MQYRDEGMAVKEKSIQPVSLISTVGTAATGTGLSENEARAHKAKENEAAKEIIIPTARQSILQGSSGY